MRIEIATLFPAMCEAVLDESIIGRARRAGIIDVRCRDIRAYTLDKHRRVDDKPFGGGMGMVMQAEPIWRCWQAACEALGHRPYTIYLSPQGRTLTQGIACELAEKAEDPSLFLLCGHYEGVDQRILDRIVDEEISVGDYVLTGGELPALVLTDCIARMCHGVLPSAAAFEDESHFSGLLEYPQYTRPEIWEGEGVPEVLLSGHHRNIAKWRRDESLRITKEKRPDMFAAYLAKNDQNM